MEETKRKVERNKNRVTYEERIVAFVDIMGFKNLVNDSLFDMAEFGRIRDALDRFRALRNEKECPELEKDIKVTTFSDSLVISYPGNYQGGLFEILLDLIYLQFDFAQIGIIVRGGISIGPLRHIREEIFGPAMNEAYYLESEKAIYPRIIIDDATIKKGLNQTYDKHFPKEYSYKYEEEEVFSLLRKDQDGYYYLDYLSQRGEFDNYEGYVKMLASVGHTISKGKLLNANNPKVLTKYDWLAKYYNLVVKELPSNRDLEPV